ncbi:ATP-binding cassette domain-containing protein [Zhihengliuella halotolerans]|uniref:Energy-coupling factor transport system ATP-binding protein n=1 Tax=Zhihengliuella halotolerans TaxID=370736 RepID=A0A4Q8ADU8_9MICC|nr:ATP-binding cassette domain-containing protein [Zhihengliuella halotolerans]RZU62430.1 energy-coupling factor transport system ATP-binding protein [Zhihengliuella halotolerans]
MTTVDPSTRVAGAEVVASGWGWRHADRTTPAVSGLDLRVSPGERVLLVGPSGAGKSTLLHALAGVVHEDDESEAAGSLSIDGVPAHELTGATGLMQQDPETQVVQSTVGDDVAFGCENHAVPREQIGPRVDAALAAVGLDVDLQASTSALSGGQKQRLALAGLLAMAPKLLLLDEPTANLDPDGVLEVRDAVVRVLDETGATAVIVEHRLSAWAPHVDRVLVLEPGGGIVAAGTPDELFAPGPVRERLIAAGVWVPGHVPVLPPVSPATGTTTALSARGLAVGRGKNDAPNLTGVDLELTAGRAVCVTGPNGAGKSTLALTLGGLLPEFGGELTYDGGSGPLARPYAWRAADLVSRIGSVFQEPEHQFVAPSVREELEYGQRHARGEDGRPLMDEAEIAARTDELLDRLGLTELAEANPFTLSGGEKRRLSVAAVLATRPRVLILDEPTFGQDANTWRELALLLRAEREAGTSIVAVTHDEHFAQAIGAEQIDVRDLGDVVVPEGPQQPRLSLEPSQRAARSFLGRANPLSKLAAIGCVTLVLIVSMDFVSAAVVVAATLMLLPLSGVRIRDFLLRAWPLLVAGLFAAWGTTLVGETSGRMLVEFGPVTISTGSLEAGLATGVRIFAVALPAVVMIASTNPTDLANALSQKLRLPHRFVLGALAAMRLVGLLAEEWQVLSMARRARGVGSHGSAWQRTKANAGQAFALIVQALRRASRLAVSMEAKGFGGDERTWARESTFRRRDAVIVVAGALVGAAAVVAAVAAGTWNVVWTN